MKKRLFFNRNTDEKTITLQNNNDEKAIISYIKITTEKTIIFHKKITMKKRTKRRLPRKGFDRFCLRKTIKKRQFPTS